MLTLLASGLARGEAGLRASVSLFHMTLFCLCFSPSLSPLPIPLINTGLALPYSVQQVFHLKSSAHLTNELSKCFFWGSFYRASYFLTCPPALCGSLGADLHWPWAPAALVALRRGSRQAGVSVQPHLQGKETAMLPTF